MRAFFTNLLAMCNMRPAAKPARAKDCEFCGGVKCFGACGAEGVFNETRDFCGRLAPDGDEGRFVCDGGKLLRFRRDSQAGRELLSACPEGARCRIVVSVDRDAITAFFSADPLDTTP
jgi:hypothetical protein